MAFVNNEGTFSFPCQHFASSLTQGKQRKLGEKNKCIRFSFGVF